MVPHDKFWRLTPGEFDQGDVFADIPILMPSLPTQQVEKTTLSGGRSGWMDARRQDPNLPFLAKGRVGLALLLSHGCTIDKGNNRRVTFAFVATLNTLPEADQAKVREGRNISMMLLPNVPDHGDCYADFRLLSTLPQDVLVASPRVSAMTPEARAQLEARYLQFFSRISESWLAENLGAAGRQGN